jgi:uncharacterized protein
MTDQNEGLWEFPCDLNVKVMAEARASLADEVCMAVNAIIPGNYVAKTKPSKNGNYESVAIQVHVTSKLLLDNMYKNLGAIPGVRMIL